MSKGKEVFDLLRQLARNAYFYLLLRSFSNFESLSHKKR